MATRKKRLGVALAGALLVTPASAIAGDNGWGGGQGHGTTVNVGGQGQQQDQQTNVGVGQSVSIKNPQQAPAIVVGGSSVPGNAAVVTPTCVDNTQAGNQEGGFSLSTPFGGIGRNGPGASQSTTKPDMPCVQEQDNTAIAIERERSRG